MPKSQELRELPLEEIEPNRSEPRHYFDEAVLDALAGSISKRCILQPALNPMEEARARATLAHWHMPAFA
jgi:hypothetical protein